MLYKSQFRKIDPYDWFCGPGSHMSEIVKPGLTSQTKRSWSMMTLDLAHHAMSQYLYSSLPF